MLAIGGAIQAMQDWIAAFGIPASLAFILTAMAWVMGATVLAWG